MKKNNLIPALALLIWAITFTSCQKEVITPAEVSTNKKLEKEDLNFQNGLLKSDPDFDLSSAINIEITIAPCPTGDGFSVTATSTDADLSNGEFTINWYKNTEQVVLFEGQTLECVCQFGVRVEVLDLDGEVVGEDSLDLGAC